MQATFSETQRFSQWWLKLIFLGLIGLAVYMFTAQIIYHKPVGSTPMSNAGLIGFCFFIIALAVLFACIKLSTKITEEKIMVRFFPFVKRTFLWDEIESAEVLDYGFVGGWGIRIGTEFGTVYNIKASKGIALKLKNGRDFLIGTQKEAELKQLLKQLKSDRD